MPWEVEYAPDTRTVVTSGSGDFSMHDALRLIEQAVRFVTENGATRVLSDFSEAIAGVSTLDILSLPKFQEKLGTPKSVKIALVLPRTGHKVADFSFYETVCRNRGFDCKAFSSRNAALKWLGLTTPP